MAPSDAALDRIVTCEEFLPADSNAGGVSPSVVVSAVIGTVSGSRVFDSILPLQLVAAEVVVHTEEELVDFISSAGGESAFVAVESNAVVSLSIQIVVAGNQLELVSEVVEWHQLKAEHVRLPKVAITEGEVSPDP